MQRLLLVLGLCLACLIGGSEPSHADSITYPWCAQYTRMGGARNCGFWTYDQCMATVTGIGGYCEANAMFRPVPGYGPPQRRARGPY